MYYGMAWSGLECSKWNFDLTRQFIQSRRMSHYVKLDNPDPRWNNAIYTGWMIKRGSFVKNWKRRYFVLTSDGKLFYFASSKKGQNPKGCWDIIGCTSMKDDKKELCLRIDRSKGGSVYFCQDSVDSQNRWMEHLKIAGCVVPEAESNTEVRTSLPPQLPGSNQNINLVVETSSSSSSQQQQKLNSSIVSPSSPSAPQTNPLMIMNTSNNLVNQQEPPPVVVNQQQQMGIRGGFSQQQQLSQNTVHSSSPPSQNPHFDPSYTSSENNIIEQPLNNDQQQMIPPLEDQQINYTPQLPILSEKRLMLKQSIQNQFAQLSQIVLSNPQNFESYLNRGRYAFEYLNNFKGALEDLKKCLQLNPKCCDAHVEIADIYASCSKWDESHQEILKISNIDVNFRSYRSEMILGKIYNERTNYEEAIRRYTNSLQLSPNFLRCIVAKALAYNYSGNLQECMNIIQHALALPAQTYWDFQAKGVAYYLCQKQEDAITNLDACLDLNPNCYLAWNTMGAINMKIDVNKSISSFIMVIHLNPAYSGAYQNLGLLLLDKNDLDNAFMYATKAMEMTPKIPNVYVIRGHVFLRRGDKVNANAEFKKAVSLQPSLEKTLRDTGFYTS